MKKEEETYDVLIVCWDDVRYIRKTTKKEIDIQRKNGYLKIDDINSLVFDFRQHEG